MEVSVWGSDFGLPCILPHSLALLTHLKFSKQPFEICSNSNPFFTKFRDIPVFKHHNISLGNLNEVVNYLRKKNIDIDSHLQSKQKSELYIYKQYINCKLKPCFQYVWWVDEKNYSESIRPWIAKFIMFPFNFHYPEKYRKNATELIDIIYGDYYNESSMHIAVYKDIHECFENLSNRLSDKEYFFGNKPTSLDVIVFSYLAPLIKIPLKNTMIKEDLQKFDNLVKFVNRINKKFFYEYEEKYALKLKEIEKKTQNKKINSEYLQHTIIAAIFATVAMLGYAHSIGLSSKLFRKKEENEFYDDDEDN